MAYPMIQFPTFAEFKDRLTSEFGCEYKQLPHSLAVGDGEPQPINYFERVVGGETRRYVVFIPDDERLVPSVIRSICAALRLNPADFGLNLG